MDEAPALLSRARGQLAGCTGVLLVGRARRDDCQGLKDVLSHRDGHLTVLPRTRESPALGRRRRGPQVRIPTYFPAAQGTSRK
jgi:hypothetical protein